MSAKTVWGTIDGNFTLEAAERFFQTFDAALGAGAPVCVIIDCRTMEDYTAEARNAFVDWMMRRRHDIAKVGIVTPKTVWHMAISTMSLVSGVPMRGFASPTEAEQYVSGEAG